MKKTLIAMAVTSLAWAAQAQVTISGQYVYGYKTSHDTSGNDAAGFGVDTSTINFSIVENLGAGKTVTAEMGFDGLTRASTAGGDSKISYTDQSFGRIEMGYAKEADIFTDIAYGGGNLIKFDSKLNQVRTSKEYLSYTALSGPVLMRYKFSESSNGSGIGLGSQGTASASTTGAVGQGQHDFIVAYLTDTLKVGAGYRKYTNADDTGGIFNGNSLTKKEIYHLEAGYDFGYMKLGAGYDHANVSWGVTQDNVLFGMSVPAGKWLFGAAWEQSRVNGVTDAPLTAVGPLTGGTASAVKAALNRVDGTASGMTVSAQYALSKRTNIAVRYATWTVSGYEQFERFGTAAATNGVVSSLSILGYKQNESAADILLSHSF
ncbi:porin [Curvibacter sp. CHRR-16]|uniref:porin n=1 Tax=Curvibacter sp. CHRR-16 TaxID=2835872 RepID=UPI001BDB4AA6|nr:porin [Curvibacter sp. CHRR-16]MBT0569644.1 porin [Curvibacter sp. CHRR-16]